MTEDKIDAIIASERKRVALRDTFAAAALPACMGQVWSRCLTDKVQVENVYEVAAIAAYEQADAMMSVREKNMYAGKGAAGQLVSRAWVDWSGGECPVDGTVLVDVRCADGSRDKGIRAGELVWAHHDTWADIVAYRISRSQP